MKNYDPYSDIRSKHSLSCTWPRYLVVFIQNRRQKVFNRGALRFCGGFGFVRGGLTLKKLTKTILICSVSCFNLGELGASFGELTPKRTHWRRDCVYFSS